VTARDDAIIRIVAAVATNDRGETLLVRKRGTAAFMQPGGKRAEGETALEALGRELLEELGCAPDLQGCRPLGTFRAPAANEADFTVEAELFSAFLAGDPRPSGEIEELVWIDPDGAIPYSLAPLTRDHAISLARVLKSERNGSA
jgi:8-oxo-dGTP diphosphatase